MTKYAFYLSFEDFVKGNIFIEVNSISVDPVRKIARSLSTKENRLLVMKPTIHSNCFKAISF